VVLDSVPTTLYLSCRVRVTEAATFNTTRFIRVLSDTDAEHCGLIFPGFGSWQVQRLLFTDIERFNSDEWNFDQWLHVEMKVIIDNTVGEVTVRFNGVEVSSTTGIDTQNGALGSSTKVVFINPTGNINSWEITDIVIMDDSGSVNNTWLGDQKFVYTLLPDGDTADEDWTLSAGTDSFDLLNDINNDPATYVESSTAAEKTLLSYGATGSEANIAAVSLHTTAKLDAHGATETFKTKIFEGATTTDGSTHTVEVDNQTEYFLDLSAATAGTFTVTVNGNTTAAQAYNVSAANLDTAITGLTGISAVTVTLNSGVYTIVFTNPQTEHTLTVDGSSLTAANSEVLTARTKQYTDIFETNPDTAAAWTAAELDGTNAGVEYV